jgi:hypothetical protein
MQKGACPFFAFSSFSSHSLIESGPSFFASSRARNAFASNSSSEPVEAGKFAMPALTVRFTEAEFSGAGKG